MKRILLDTNLLLLLVVGRLGEGWVGKHRRLQEYSAEDFEILRSILSRFQRIVTTPHILAETSNLARLTAEPLATYAGHSLKELIGSLDERSKPAIEVVELDLYSRLGLTDAGIHSMLDDCVLLSADVQLYLACSESGYSSYNFNHFRDGTTQMTL